MERSNKQIIGGLLTLVMVLVAPLYLAQAEEVSWSAVKGVFGEEGEAFKAGGPNPRPTIWADCERFDSIVAPATFDPDSGPFDELYAGGDGFKNGVPLISDSKPGDMDFNGGRWHMNVLKDSVSPDKYVDACAFEDLDPNDFMSTDNYFECPMLPRRGRNPSYQMND